MDFLSDLSAGEAALILDRVDAQLREDLLSWLPSDLRQSLDALRGASQSTRVSA